MPAKDEAKTMPKPIAKGPPIVKNFSDGAHTAIVDRPPTIPAVYQAALSMIGPPIKHSGAMTAPIIAECAAHANCLLPKPGLYGIERATIPEPII